MANGTFLVSEKLVILPEERHEDRFYVEQRKLKDTFPQFKIVAESGNIIGCKGYLTTNLGKDYGFRVWFKEPYPSNMPYVETIGWTVKNGCPHTNSSTNPCVYHSRYWRNFNTMAFMVAKCALWANKYDLWLRTGRWSGKEHGQ